MRRPCLTRLVKHGTDRFLHIDTLSLPDISQPSHPHSAPPPSNSLPRKNPGGHRHRWVRAGLIYAWHCLRCFGLLLPLNHHHHRHHCRHCASFVLVVGSNWIKDSNLVLTCELKCTLLRVLIKRRLQRIKWEEMQIQQRQKAKALKGNREISDLSVECMTFGEGGHVQLWL